MKKTNKIHLPVSAANVNGLDAWSGLLQMGEWVVVSSCRPFNPKFHNGAVYRQELVDKSNDRSIELLAYDLKNLTKGCATVFEVDVECTYVGSEDVKINTWKLLLCRNDTDIPMFVYNTQLLCKKYNQSSLMVIRNDANKTCIAMKIRKRAPKAKDRKLSKWYKSRIDFHFEFLPALASYLEQNFVVEGYKLEKTEITNFAKCYHYANEPISWEEVTCGSEKLELHKESLIESGVNKDVAYTMCVLETTGHRYVRDAWKYQHPYRIRPAFPLGIDAYPFKLFKSQSVITE